MKKKIWIPVIITLAIVFVLLFVFLKKAKNDKVVTVLKKYDSALIMIHGYANSGSRIKELLGGKLESLMPNTVFYFPTAPVQVTPDGYQWFSMGKGVTYERMLREAEENVNLIKKVIDEIHEKDNIPYENINIAGFSQGGLMSVLSALTIPEFKGRAISFSGMPFLKIKNFDDTKIINKPDVLLIHGTSDDLVSKESSIGTAGTLKNYGINHTVYMIDGMHHEINDEALQKMAEFLK